jgi:hypothetical protein
LRLFAAACRGIGEPHLYPNAARIPHNTVFALEGQEKAFQKVSKQRCVELSF